MSLLIHAEPLDRPDGTLARLGSKKRGEMFSTPKVSLYTKCSSTTRFIRSTLINTAKPGVKDSPQ